MYFDNLTTNLETSKTLYGVPARVPEPLVYFDETTCSQVPSPNLQPLPLPPYLMNKTYLAELEVAKANAKKTHEYHLKSELEFQKNCYAEKREETRERHRRERELVQSRVFENPDGFLCVEQSYPDGTTKHSCAVLSIRRVRMKKFVCPMIPEKNSYIVCWRENPQGVKIPESEMTTEKLAKVLQQHGVVLHVSRAKRAETLDAIFSFLFENLEAEEDLLIFGWNKTKVGWKFHREL